MYTLKVREIIWSKPDVETGSVGAEETKFRFYGDVVDPTVSYVFKDGKHQTIVSWYAKMSDEVSGCFSVSVDDVAYLMEDGKTVEVIRGENYGIAIPKAEQEDGSIRFSTI